jgi:D-ribose pyranase
LKKTGLLNKEISEVVASMGHTDTLTIGDAGLPIPSSVRRIDLALRKGVPGLLETVEIIATELKVDRIIVANETCEKSPQIAEGLRRIFASVPWQMVSHEELKALMGTSRAIIRTGECTPYANVILVSGVIF